MSLRTSSADLLRRLVAIGDHLVQDRRVQVADTTLRELRDEVARCRLVPCEDDPIIGYEAANLVECLSAIAYARTEKNTEREGRAITYANSLLSFLGSDLRRLEKVTTQ